MSSYDVLNLARISDWKAAIDRVRAAYVKHHGRKPRLLRPSRFTEKIQWRKLFDLNPVYAVLSDKLAVREFIAERVGADVLIPLLWVGDDPDAIPFDTLDPPYIIKSTHASGHVLKVRSRDDLDVPAARAMFRQWLAQCYATHAEEPGYRPVPRQLIVEQLVLDPDGAPPLEHKMFVFGGRVRIIQTIVVDRDGKRRGVFHDSNWVRLNWRTISSPFEGLQPRSARATELVALAERAGRVLSREQLLDAVRGAALEQGRDVFAVPGSILSSRSAGVNKLIQDGARPVMDVKDILEALNLFMIPQHVEMQAVLHDYSEVRTLLPLLSSDPYHGDELLRESGLRTMSVTARLTMMWITARSRTMPCTSGMSLLPIAATARSFAATMTMTSRSGRTGGARQQA